MLIQSLSLQNFRNFSMSTFDFAKTSLIYGINGSGKTSIIEAISLLASSESFRAAHVEEMLRLESELGRVQGIFQIEADEEIKLEVMLTKGEVQGKKTAFRLFAINDVRKSKKKFLGNLAAVTFRPEDLRLVEGSPARRRGFLDTAISLVSERYRLALTSYEQTLRRRNRLLQQVREGEIAENVLNYWNLSLIKNGQILQSEREKFIDFIREVVFPFTLNIEYLPSLISNTRQEEYLSREIAAGHSLIGPHKDDFLLKFSDSNKGIEDLSLLAYGSRGQQRLGVLWIKMAELQFLHDKIGFQPILLLDDIFSELDEKSKAMVLSLLNNYQSILTTADADVLAELKTAISDLKITIL